MNIVHELQQRGLVHQTTAPIEDIISSLTGLYCGFDPSGNSLHIGSLLPLINMMRFKHHGFRVVGLVGGATGMIGDPSGKSAERNLIDAETLQSNIDSISKQIAPFCNEVMNNAEWSRFTFIDFIRDIGKHFSVGSMLSRDSVSSRLKTGISFTEFSYMLLQGNDFLELSNRGVNLQIGGSDQYGNICSGIDLISKKTDNRGFGITIPLLLKPDGTKFGKTENGAIWLDSKKTSHWDFHQFWMSISDDMVESLLKKLTFVSLEDIESIMIQHNANPNLRIAQKKLAFSITAIVHGEEIAMTMESIAEKLFANRNATFIDFSESEMSAIMEIIPVTNKTNIVDVLIELRMVQSKNQANTELKQNAVRGNGVVVNDRTFVCTNAVIRKGKKDMGIVKTSSPSKLTGAHMNNIE